MLWAWGLIIGIAAGLPAAAWWFSRKLRPARLPLSTPPGRFDSVGHWLFGHYHLGVLDRHKVVQAVFVTPVSLDDPPLRRAACALAGDVLSGKLKPYGPQRVWGWAMLGFGLAYAVFGVVELVVSHSDRGGLPVWYPMAYGLLWAVGGAVAGVWAPRRVLRHVRRAQELNQDAAR
jgi:hypothetical protein